MTLNEIEQRLAALKSEQDNLTAELERLKADKSEVKPWRAEHNSTYYMIRETGKSHSYEEAHDITDSALFRVGNYYRTRELAEQDAKVLALRGRVRQLRDALCEEYQFVPFGLNYCIRFDCNTKKYYDFLNKSCVAAIGEIYFDTEEHAQQACDILNAEAHNGT